MQTINELRGPYGTRMSDTYRHIPARVVMDNGARGFDLCAVTADTLAWDGAAEGTTHAVYSYRTDAFSYVELRITGRSARTHTGGAYGTKGRMRFTGADDSGEWLDVVIGSAETLALAA